MDRSPRPAGCRHRPIRWLGGNQTRCRSTSPLPGAPSVKRPPPTKYVSWTYGVRGNPCLISAPSADWSVDGKSRLPHARRARRQRRSRGEFRQLGRWRGLPNLGHGHQQWGAQRRPTRPPADATLRAPTGTVCGLGTRRTGPWYERTPPPPDATPRACCHRTGAKTKPLRSRVRSDVAPATLSVEQPLDVPPCS